MKHIRRLVQAGTTLLYNFNISGFFTGNLYDGKTKAVCVPGLNCYSCPGAVGACPVGSLSTAAATGSIDSFMYVSGLLLLFGTLLGRFICGWACPFGFVQELLYMIPVRKVHVRMGIAKYMKYAVLVLMVIGIPLLTLIALDAGTVAFCKYVCPSGTLSGALLMASNSKLAAGAGTLFYIKLAFLVVTLCASILIYRPFCRILCPLGALYGACNKIAVVRYECDTQKCMNCGMCERVCKMEVKPNENCNSAECIRCGECIKVCKTNAINVKTPFGRHNTNSAKKSVD